MRSIFILTLALVLASSLSSYAQFDDLLNKAKDKIAHAIDNPSDNKKSNNKSENNTTKNNSINNQAATTSQQETTKTYKNYDFVPGDTIIFESQLEDEEEGEIPSQFTLTDGQMDVQSEDGENVIHVPKGAGAAFSPRMKNANYLPDRFTVEFDAKNENFGTAHITIRFGNENDNIQELHFNDGGGLNWTTGDVDNPDGLVTDGSNKNVWHHFAIAINKNQGKVYIDQYRIANVNNITGKAQSIIFAVNGYENSFIKNIRIASGGIDVYKKIISDGKIITHGILFDIDKASIKPQSMGTINKIYRLLKKDASLKFEIDGHTDNSGDAKHNMELSQQRADAVKAELVNLGIDSSRLTTKGFGDTKPIDSNDTPEGKANNRRVEFIKI